MVTVRIEPEFGDERMEGEYDNDRYLEAETEVRRALRKFIAAGARSENVVETVANGLIESGVG